MIQLYKVVLLRSVLPVTKKKYVNPQWQKKPYSHEFFLHLLMILYALQPYIIEACLSPKII